MIALAHLVVHHRKAKYDVLIDRTTRWGNPFIIGKDGDRDTVIAKYEGWLLKQPGLVALAKIVLKGKILGCWCVPKRCHGHILARIANG